jgi:hypothetical protein
MLHATRQLQVLVGVHHLELFTTTAAGGGRVLGVVVETVWMLLKRLGLL